jgi:ribosome recycling factor
VALGKLAGVMDQGDRTVITPFDLSNTSSVVKVLAEARLNAYALNPRTVAVGVPPVSGEQRQELARHVQKLSDETKVAVRAIRHDDHKKIN